MEKTHEYEKSNDTREVVAGKALALLLWRTEKMNEQEIAGPDVEDQIRRNVETIVDGHVKMGL